MTSPHVHYLRNDVVKILATFLHSTSIWSLLYINLMFSPVNICPWSMRYCKPWQTHPCFRVDLTSHDVERWWGIGRGAFMFAKVGWLSLWNEIIDKQGQTLFILISGIRTSSIFIAGWAYEGQAALDQTRCLPHQQSNCSYQQSNLIVVIVIIIIITTISTETHMTFPDNLQSIAVSVKSTLMLYLKYNISSLALFSTSWG